MKSTPKFLLSLSLLAITASTFAAEPVVPGDDIKFTAKEKLQRLAALFTDSKIVTKTKQIVQDHPTAAKVVVGTGLAAGVTAGAVVGAYKKFPAVQARVDKAATWVRNQSVNAKNWTVTKATNAKNWTVDKATAGKTWVNTKWSELDNAKFSKADAAIVLATVGLGYIVYNNLPQGETVKNTLSSAKDTVTGKFAAVATWFSTKAKDVAANARVQKATAKAKLATDWIMQDRKHQAIPVAVVAAPVVGYGIYKGYKAYKAKKAAKEVVTPAKAQ